MKIVLSILLLCVFFADTYSQDTTQQNSASDDTSKIDSTVTLSFEMVMAAWRGDSSYTMRLLKAGADVNSLSDDNISALIYTVQEGHLPVVKILAANGADLNYSYSGVQAALIVAVLKNHFEIAKYLLHKNANVNISDGPENTALFYAVAYGYPKMVKLLLAYKADPNLKNRYGESPLWMAAYNGDLMTVYELLVAGADINTVNNKGNTPLMMAAMYNDTAMISYLLKNKADINKTNMNAQTATDLAVIHSRWEAFKILSTYKTPPKEVYREFKKSLISNGNYSLMDSARALSKTPYLLPYIGSMSIGYSCDFTYNDMMFSPFLIWSEKRYRTAFRLGWSARYWRNRVTFISNDVKYQLWERRNDFYAGMEKKIRISHEKNINHSCIIAGVQANYSVIRYRGIEKSPAPAFTFSPYLGYTLTGKYGGYGIRYLYYPTGDSGLSPHRIGLYFTITLYNRNNEKYLTKCSICY